MKIRKRFADQHINSLQLSYLVCQSCGQDANCEVSMFCTKFPPTCPNNLHAYGTATFATFSRVHLVVFTQYYQFISSPEFQIIRIKLHKTSRKMSFQLKSNVFFSSILQREDFGAMPPKSVLKINDPYHVKGKLLKAFYFPSSLMKLLKRSRGVNHDLFYYHFI